MIDSGGWGEYTDHLSHRVKEGTVKYKRKARKYELSKGEQGPVLSGWDIRVGLGAHCQTRAQGKGAPGRNDPLILLSLSRFLTVELALATPGLNSLSAIRARAIS